MEWDDIDKFITMKYDPQSPNPSEEDVLKEKALLTVTQGFLTLQNSIDKMIINHETSDEDKLYDEELYEAFKTRTYLVKPTIVCVIIFIIYCLECKNLKYNSSIK